ncbi:PLASMA MEMBRANE ATPASE, partial [Salix koriyanagi]
MDNTANALEAISKETVDLENVPVEEVFERLKCTKEGSVTMTFKSGWGESKILKFWGLYVESIVMGYGSSSNYGTCTRRGKLMQGKGTDYHDFNGILALLIINSTISFIEENNAGNAAAALMVRLAPEAKVQGLFL